MNGRTHPTPTTSLRDDDQQVAAEVTSRLALTGRLLSQRVTVTASAHEVTLRGRVSTYYEKQLAQAVALPVIGHRRLENYLDVA